MSIKIGDLFTVEGTNTNGHNYVIGRTYKALRDDIGSGVNGQDIETEFIGNNITNANYRKIAFTVEKIEKEITKLEETITEKKLILEWMKSNDVKEYDSLEFKCWSCLKTINQDISEIEKAKIIAKLISK